MATSTKIATLLLCGVTAASVLAAPATEGGRKLEASLTGAAEVPGPGDSDGSGTARIIVNPGQMRICYELEVSNIAPATAAHIHVGAAGTAGPPVVTLDPPSDGDSTGCIDVTREMAMNILRNPSGYYVNVHNADFGPGAIRGQLANQNR